MRSSYAQHNYSLLFTQTVILRYPSVIVDLGLLDGYSTLHLAKGAAWLNDHREWHAHIYAYDLFDDYEFKHGDLQSIATLIDENKLSKVVTLRKGSAFDVFKDFHDGSVNLLHIDISNDGEKVETLIQLWSDKMSNSGLILIEGGSEERDQVAWMTQFNKPPIRPALSDCARIKTDFWPPYIHELFPSMTVLQKKMTL